MPLSEKYKVGLQIKGKKNEILQNFVMWESLNFSNLRISFIFVVG